MKPDLAGFREAQARLSDAFDEAVTFLVPSAADYAPGTEVDPESGESYDPWAEGQKGETDTEVVVKASVVNRPSATTDDATSTAIGVIPADSIVLLLYPEEHARVLGAERFRTEDSEWLITEFRSHTTFGMTKYLYYGKRA